MDTCRALQPTYWDFIKCTQDTTCLQFNDVHISLLLMSLNAAHLVNMHSCEVRSRAKKSC